MDPGLPDDLPQHWAFSFPGQLESLLPPPYVASGSTTGTGVGQADFHWLLVPPGRLGPPGCPGPSLDATP